MMLCALCFHGPNSQTSDPRDVKDAKFIVNGQGVCEDHVDNTSLSFGRSLFDLWEEHRTGRKKDD